MKQVIRALAAVLFGSALSFTSDAAIVEFQLGTQFVSVSAGDNIPTTTSILPIGTLRFEDVAPQQVRLTVTSSLEASAEFFDRILFNGIWDRPQDIGFALQSTTGAFNLPTVGKSNNTFTINPPGGVRLSAALHHIRHGGKPFRRHRIDYLPADLQQRIRMRPERNRRKQQPVGRDGFQRNQRRHVRKSRLYGLVRDRQHRLSRCRFERRPLW